jgi:hypothetical protein
LQFQVSNDFKVLAYILNLNSEIIFLLSKLTHHYTGNKIQTKFKKKLSNKNISFFFFSICLCVPHHTRTNKQTFLQTTPSVIEITEIPDEEVEPVELSPVETEKPEIVVEDVTKPVSPPPTTTTTTKTQIKEEQTKVEKTKVIRKKVSRCLAFQHQCMMMPN